MSRRLSSFLLSAALIAPPAHATICSNKPLSTSAGGVSQIAACYQTTLYFPVFTASSGTPAPSESYQRWMLVWTDSTNLATTGTDLVRATVTPDCFNPVYVAAQPVVTAAGDQRSPAIDYTYASSPTSWWWVLAYEQVTAGGSDLMVRRLDRFSVQPNPPLYPWDQQSIVLCDAAGDQTAPIVIGDPTGGGFTYVLWTDRRDGNAQVYAQRLDGTGTPQWDANGTPVAPGSTEQELCAATQDGSGGLYVCWIDRGDGTSVRVQRLATAGFGYWSDESTLVPGSAGVSGWPRIAVDANGLAVMWTDVYGDPGGDVVQYRVEPWDGYALPPWEGGPTAVASGPEPQRLDDLTTDDQNALFAVWEQESTDPVGDVDIWAARIDVEGAALAGWPAAMLVHPARQQHARTLYSGGGKYVVVFADDRNADRDIYCAGRDANAAVLQQYSTTNAVCTAGGIQDDPIPAGMVVAWPDRRNAATTGTDYYVSFVGTIKNSDVEEARPLQVTLAAPYPNPTRGTATFMLSLSAEAMAEIEILDCAGRLVRSLDRGVRALGRYQVRWDGRDGANTPAAPGLYFVRLRAGATSLQRPFVLLR